MQPYYIGKILSKDKNGATTPLKLQQTQTGKIYLKFTVGFNTGVEGITKNPKNPERNYNITNFINVTVWDNTAQLMDDITFEEGDYFVGMGTLVNKEYHTRDGQIGKSLELSYVKLDWNLMVRFKDLRLKDERIKQLEKQTQIEQIQTETEQTQTQSVDTESNLDEHFLEL